MPDSPSTPPCVHVALPLPVETLFTYAVPEGLAEPVQEGARVVVPFGPRRLTGVVVAQGVVPDDPERVRPVERVLSPGPVVPGEMLELTHWVSEYYMCSWGEAIRAALPPGSDVRPRTERTVRLVQPEPTVRGAKQQAVIDVLARAGAGEHALTSVLERAQAAHATINSLAAKGIVAFGEREVSRIGAAPADGIPPVPVDRFHDHQRHAADRLAAAVDQGRYRAFLLHGVTGSGKTEVYMAALDRALSTGRGGIVLVPEIALTPQTVRRFRSRFGDRIAVLHSRMSDGERFDAWRAIDRGDFDVVIGPRSAVFAPVHDLGLIVVDEEHDTSYKQFDPAPRYHARDVAVMRASRAGAVCVLGSATPSLESLYNARGGKYELLSMPERVTVPGHEPARLPEVRIIDLGAERRSGRLDRSLSAALETAIRKRLADGQQVILLQNRRGYAPVLECIDCGWSPQCPDCAVTLTYHKALRQLRCHYCGRAFRHDPRCGGCGNESYELLGTGTQRVEEEVAAQFPDARVLRMDLDTTAGRDTHDRILTRFGAGEADILLGTQMVAKGLDFERVTLVGVINADAGLLLPDLRADERVFQLLTQVSGRAGRATLRGEVLLQTRNPDHPVILLAKRHDYDGFAETMLPTRHALGYPPFTRLVRVDFRGPDEHAVERFADRWKKVFDSGGHEIDCLGPAPAFVPRVRKTWRRHVLLRAARSVPTEAIREVIAAASDRAGRPPARTRIAVDVDPMDLL